jgi:hypothetical protein
MAEIMIREAEVGMNQEELDQVRINTRCFLAGRES